MSLGLLNNKAWFECLVGLEEGVQTKPRSGFVLIIASCWLFFKCFFKHGINCSHYGGLASFDLSQVTAILSIFLIRVGQVLRYNSRF